MVILNGLQPLLLLYLFISDLAEQPVPLFELDRDHVLSLIKSSDGGVCPFVVTPSFLLEDSDATIVLDYSADGYRKLSFVDNGLNFSFVHGKLRYLMENFGDSFEKFTQRIAEQLSFSHFFGAIFKPTSADMTNKMSMIQLWVLYVFVVVSVCSLWNYEEKGNVFTRQRVLFSAFSRTRFLVVVYAIGRPSSRYRLNSSVDAQDIALFFIWSVTIGLNYFMTTLFYELVLHCKNRNSFNYQVFKAAFIVFLVGVVVFAITLLSYVVLPRSRHLIAIYLVMLVADALRLTMNSLAEILHILDLGSNEISRFGVVVLSCSADLFESFFIGSAIYYGLFVRRRLITIALCSYNCHVINRLITLDYPELRPKNDENSPT